MTGSTRVLLAVMWCALLASSLGVIWAKQQSRNQFVELQRLEKERDQLDTEWGQLRLEQGTLVTYGRIEKIGREQLNMVEPDPRQLCLVVQGAPDPSCMHRGSVR